MKMIIEKKIVQGVMVANIGILVIQMVVLISMVAIVHHTRVRE